MGKKKVIAKNALQGFYVNLWSGQKGGTGKTFGSGIDAQRHVDRGTDFWLLDIDQGNMATGQRYKKYLFPKIATLHEQDNRLSAANVILDAGSQKPTVVNCRAGTNEKLIKWIENRNVSQIAKQCGVLMRYFFVSDLEKDSLSMFRATAEMFAPHMPIIFVANLGCNATGLDYFESDGFQNLLNHYQVPVVKIKAFDIENLKIMEGHNAKGEVLNWGQAREHPDLGIIGRAEIQAYLEDVYGQLDAAERFADMGFASRAVPGAAAVDSGAGLQAAG